jgi:uncharacterized RDD family membrane protein YckC
MKCPKCGYLGFETTDRCRNCNYDFSLAERPPATRELSLRDERDSDSALADFDLSGAAASMAVSTAPSVDLRIDAEATGTITPSEDDFEPLKDAPRSPVAKPTLPTPTDEPAARPRSSDDARPTVSAPRPAGEPLSVRRATPEVARPRPTRSSARAARAHEPTLLDGVAEPAPAGATFTPAAAHAVEHSAGAVARVSAALIDIVLLAGIDAVVVLLTARATGLSTSPEDLAVLGSVPFGAFLGLLALGYLVGFTAGGGQTIGKMAFGLRVVDEDGSPVDLTGAVLRSTGALAAALTLGLLYVPALVTSDRRALHDRFAGTRVVKVRA